MESKLKRLMTVIYVLLSAIPDLLALTGAILMAFGAWQVYPPAGFILGGLLLLVVGLIGVIRR